MNRWKEVCEQLSKLDDTKQTNIFWAILGILESNDDDYTFEVLKKEVEIRVKK
jgi:hypothetical protein